MLPKILIGIFFVLLAVFVLRPFGEAGPLGKLSQNTPSLVSKDSSSSKNSPVKLTHPIFKAEEIDWVSPLGESNGGYIEMQPLGGMTVNIKKEIAEKRPIEVYAPTDLNLVAYSFTVMDPEPTPDWSLHFKINEDLSLVLHHIKNVSQKIIDVAGSTPKKNDSRTTDVRWPKEVKFKAGEVIGTTTGTSLARNWNIYLYDKKIKNPFINQGRFASLYSSDNLLTAACIFDYYEDVSVKNDFYKLLGSTKAGQATSCGNPSTDKKGTLSGLWHAKKEGIDMGSYDGPYADPFSIFKKSDQTVSIYEMNKLPYTVNPDNPTYKDPGKITTSHCYQLTDNWNPSIFKGYAYFRVDSDTQMSAVYNPSGSCPASFPAELAKKYYR